jgi:hypothetical protein
MEDQQLDSYYEAQTELPEQPYDGGGEFNEYNDADATACAAGDYNTWEDNQVFMDNE